MRRKISWLPLGILLVSAVSLCLPSAGQMANPQTAKAPAGGTPWTFDATYIEACSCHLFCPCYFNTQAEHPYCEFQMAIRVNNGKVGTVALNGAKFWLTGDLGEHWGDQHKSPWLVVTFDPATTQEQRDAIVKILPKLYPTDFGKVDVDEAAISWSVRGTEARAKLANGKGEMVLEQFKGADGGKSVLHNVKYWTADKNDGFVMYKSKVHRWEGFGHKFSYSGRNAFTIHVQSGGTL